MNNLLRPLLNAGSEQERQQRIDELLTIHVARIVRQVLRQRRLYVSTQGVNESNPDAEDLYQEALTRMVEVLHGDRRVLTTIEDFEAYVGRIVSNICIDFLRSKHPTRARLKNTLRDVLRRHKDLLSWQYQDEILCGFAVWRNTGKEAVDAYDIEAKLKGFVATRFADEDVGVVRLSRIVTELFHWLGGPVPIDVLVRMVAHVRDLKKQQTESLDNVTAEINFRSSIRSTQSDIETHELLGRLWHIIKGFTSKERDAFVLRFQDHDGRNLFSVLLGADIVDWDELVEVMGRELDDLTRLWWLMPMDAATTASELRTSLKNVYKWRFRARQKLKSELK